MRWETSIFVSLQMIEKSEYMFGSTTINTPKESEYPENKERIKKTPSSFAKRKRTLEKLIIRWAVGTHARPRTHKQASQMTQFDKSSNKVNCYCFCCLLCVSSLYFNTLHLLIFFFAFLLENKIKFIRHRRGTATKKTRPLYGNFRNGCVLFLLLSLIAGVDYLLTQTHRV